LSFVFLFIYRLEQDIDFHSRIWERQAKYVVAVVVGGGGVVVVKHCHEFQ